MAPRPIAPTGTFAALTYISREFEQGGVGIGMCMAVACALFIAAALLDLNCARTPQAAC